MLLLDANLLQINSCCYFCHFFETVNVNKARVISLLKVKVIPVAQLHMVFALFQNSHNACPCNNVQIINYKKNFLKWNHIELLHFRPIFWIVESFRCLSGNGFHLHLVPSPWEGRCICSGGDNSQICQRKYRPATRSTSTLALVSILYCICICLHFLFFISVFVSTFFPILSFSAPLKVSRVTFSIFHLGKQQTSKRHIQHVLDWKYSMHTRRSLTH